MDSINNNKIVLHVPKSNDLQNLLPSEQIKVQKTLNICLYKQRQFQKYMHETYELSLRWDPGGQIRDELDIYFHLHASVSSGCFVGNHISCLSASLKFFKSLVSLNYLILQMKRQPCSGLPGHSPQGRGRLHEEGNWPAGLDHGAGFMAEFLPQMETQVLPWFSLGKM